MDGIDAQYYALSVSLSVHLRLSDSRQQLTTVKYTT